MKKVEFSTAQNNENFDDILDVSPEEVWEKNKEVYLIDVRSEEEYTGELGHVPGSLLIVLDTLPEKLDELPTDKPIVFICRSGMRSAKATQIAQSFGLIDTYNMSGGMLAWNAMNLITEK